LNTIIDNYEKLPKNIKYKNLIDNLDHDFYLLLFGCDDFIDDFIDCLIDINLYI
jgi:hypothetical protein